MIDGKIIVDNFAGGGGASTGIEMATGITLNMDDLKLISEIARMKWKRHYICKEIRMIDFGYYNVDCMEGMKQFPDKYFDIAIVDPPYFKGPERRKFYGRKVNPIGAQRVYQCIDSWDIPTESYFNELVRVSKHQIIWGCNYFNYHFGSGRIVWDKCNDKTDFSDCEIAFCSMHDSVRIFRYMWRGMFQGKSIEEGTIQQGNKRLNEKRIHPTQKPVNLYRWILQKYKIPSDWKILDTHVGSASSLIAFHENGNKFVGFEKDKYMYDLSMNRYNVETAQIRLIDLA